MFLLGCGIDSLVEAHSGDRSVAEQARKLLLPGEMGERFQVMALTRGLDTADSLRGFSLRDLSHRL
jgi:SAM-dependent MidA family methyltransferase